MPHRICLFCGASDSTLPRRSFHVLKNDVKHALGLPEQKYQDYKYICHIHFDPSDVISGEKRTKLSSEAFPIRFPLEVSTNHDHDYLPQEPSEDAKEGEASDDEETPVSSPWKSQSNSQPQSCSQTSDVSWKPSQNTETDQPEEDDESDDEDLRESYVLVSKKWLMKLLRKCQSDECSSYCEVQQHLKGAQLNCKMTCLNSHNNEWQSSDNVEEKKSSGAIINIHLATWIFQSGLNYSNMKEFFVVGLKCPFISVTSYNWYISNLLYPNLAAYWQFHQSEVFDHIRSIREGAVNFAGDGR